MLPVENIEQKFYEVLETDEWKKLQKVFTDCSSILIIGNGGNLAIADHAASDISRLTGKNATAPGSGIVLTALITDESWEQAMALWVAQRSEVSIINKTLLIAISSSGNAKNIMEALKLGWDYGCEISMISAKPTHHKMDDLTNVVLNVEHFHTAEVLSLLLMYELIHSAGFECPLISEKNSANLSKRVVGFNDELTNIAVDFDGVLHKNSKGFHDGTIYDNPIEGACEGLKELAKHYKVVVSTVKARLDRGLVDGKTGAELVWEWLEKQGMAEYISEVTAEKPRGIAYIDDRSIRFTTWEEALNHESLHRDS